MANTSVTIKYVVKVQNIANTPNNGDTVLQRKIYREFFWAKSLNSRNA